MRRPVRLLLAGAAMAGAIAYATLAMFFAAPGAAAAQTAAERITSYDARIAIRPDGSILVTEQITYDFGTDQRHGILRVIPVRFRYNGSYDRIYPVDVHSVRSADAPDQYAVENDGSSVTIRIGNPNRTVTGEHTYTIAYLVRGSLNAFASHDELYWNAVGNRWNVPIDHASVSVSAPEAVTRAACFSGPSGSTRSCQHAGITAGTVDTAARLRGDTGVWRHRRRPAGHGRGRRCRAGPAPGPLVLRAGRPDRRRDGRAGRRGGTLA